MTSQADGGCCRTRLLRNLAELLLVDDIAVVHFFFRDPANSGTPPSHQLPIHEGILILCSRHETAEYIEFLLVEQEIFVQLVCTVKHDEFLEATGGMEIRSQR